MAEYIDREVLLLRIDCHGTNKFGMLDEDIRDFVKSQPAADVAPVVRCKDCRYAYRMDGPKEEYDCRKISAFAKFFQPDHFCAYGERK